MVRKYGESFEHDDADEDDGIIWATPEEWETLFERRARKAMGISADAFRRRFAHGEFDLWDANVHMLSLFLP